MSSECCHIPVQDKDGALHIAEDVRSVMINQHFPVSSRSVRRAKDLRCTLNVFTGFDGWPCSCRRHRRRDRIYSSSGTPTGPYLMNVVQCFLRQKTLWRRFPEIGYPTLSPAGGGRGPSWNSTRWKVTNERGGSCLWCRKRRMRTIPHSIKVISALAG